MAADWGSAVGRRWREFWRTPETGLVDAGAAGEIFVARVRLALAALVWAVPVVDLFTPPRDRETLIGLAAASFGVLVAYFAYRLSLRLYRPWIGFATSLMDVTLVSLALAGMFAIGQPHGAVNSRVIYEIYLLAIAATALRFDPRICVATGLVALLEYGGLVLYAVARWDLNDPAYAPFPYGLFNWSDAVSRMVLLVIAAVLSAAVVSRTRRLQWLSARDRLTGLLNRAVFDDLLLDEVSRAQRSGRPFAVVMIDVDRFKPFNDTYGHLAGDRALQAVAGAIRRVVRQRETVARYGGDEFVLLLPETPPDVALGRAEQIRAAAAAAPLTITGVAGPVVLTVSVGVAAQPGDGTDGREVLRRADTRLYEAKTAGRNCVVGPPLEASPPPH